jgi:hypothetical protein
VVKCDKGVGQNFTPKSCDVNYKRSQTNNSENQSGPHVAAVINWLGTSFEIKLTVRNISCF